MYAIKCGEYLACQRNGLWFLSNENIFRIVRESSQEIDQLLQQFIVDTGCYNAVVYKLTEEELEEFTIKKLKWH